MDDIFPDTAKAYSIHRELNSSRDAGSMNIAVLNNILSWVLCRYKSVFENSLPQSVTHIWQKQFLNTLLCISGEDNGLYLWADEQALLLVYPEKPETVS